MRHFTCACLAFACSLPVVAIAAPIVRGTGDGALIDNDLTDVGDNGVEGGYVDGATVPPAVLSGFDARFFSSSESGFGGGEFAYNVFDNLTGGGGNKWCCEGVSEAVDGSGVFVGADLSQTQATGASTITLNQFTLTSSNDTPGRDPDVWFIQGSNDGSTWTNIYSHTLNTNLWTARDQVLEFSVANGDFAIPAGYKQFRLFADSTAGAGVFALSEMELYGYQYWDMNGAAAGAGSAAFTGTWGATANWSYSDTGTSDPGVWINGGDAFFSAGTDATNTSNIAVAAGVTTRTMTVQEGTINLTSGTLSVTGGGNSMLINGGATLRLSGATVNNPNGVVYVGDTTAGTLDMTGGSLTAMRLDVGNPTNGPGFVTQSGGTITLNGGGGLPGMRLSHWPGSGRTYNMSGGVLNSGATTIAIGWDGSGTMTVNGTADVNAGTVQIQRSSTLTIGGSATFDATGEMKVGDDRGAGTLNIQDFSLVNINSFSIGDDGGDAGTVNQSGGTVNVTGGFRLGHWPSAISIYNMSGGVLNIVGASNLEEGAGTLTVGVDGTGDFNHSGGNISAHRMHLNARLNNLGGVSTYDLTGGVLTLGAGGITGNVDAGSSFAINLGGGTVAASASWSSPLNMTLTGTGGTTKFDTNGSSITLTGNITGSQNVEKTDAGSLVFNGAGQTVAISNLYVTGGDVTIGGTTTATIDNVALGTDSTFSNPVVGAGSGTLNVQGSAVVNAGSFSIGDRPTFSGTVNQSGGTVNVSGGFRVGHWPTETSNYNISAGTLNLTGTPGAVINPAGVGEQNGVIYLGVDGTGNLTVSGTASVNAQAIVLDARGNTAGTDTFSMTGGTVTLTSTTAFGNGIRTGSLDANTSYQINLGGGTLAAGGTSSWSSPLNMALTGTGGNTTFDTNGAGNTITLSGLLSGPGGLIKNDLGTLALMSTSGSPRYTGGTTVNGGILSLAGGNNGQSSVGTGTLTINAAGTVVATAHNVFGHSADANIPKIIINGGTLTPFQYLHVREIEMTGGTITLGGTLAAVDGLDFGHSPNTLTTFAGAGTATVDAKVTTRTNTTFTVANDGAAINLALNGPVVGAGGITKNGAGTLALTNTAAAARYSGGTTVNAGTLQLGGGNNGFSSVGTGQLTINPGASVVATAHNVFGHSADANIPHVIINGGTLTPFEYLHVRSIEMTGGTITAGGTSAGDGLDFGHSPNTLTTHASPTTATIDSKITTRSNTTITVADHAATPIDLLVNGAVVGSGGVTKNGAGRMTLSGLGKLYTGTTNLNAGILEIRDVGSASGDGYRSNMVNSSEVWLTATTGQVSDHRANISGTGSLVKKDTGRVRIGTWSGLPALTYTGTTTVEAGILDLQGQAAGRGFDTTGGLIINPGAEFWLSGLAAQTQANAARFGALSGAGTVRGLFGTPWLEIGNGGGSGTFTGLITNNAGVPLSLVKSGTGTQVLTGNNTYTGVTNVNAGTLIVDGTTTGQGLITVASGARLGGDGNIGANLNVVGTPGAVSPGGANLPYTPPATPGGYTGHSFDATYSAAEDTTPGPNGTVGLLTVTGNVDLDGYLLIDLVSPSLHDQFNVNGDVDIGIGSANNNHLLEINGKEDFTQISFWGDLGFEMGDRVDLLTAGDIDGDFFNTLAFVNGEFTDASGRRIFFGNDGTSIFLQAVPEPGSIALWTILGLAAALGAWRKRRCFRCS